MHMEDRLILQIAQIIIDRKADRPIKNEVSYWLLKSRFILFFRYAGDWHGRWSRIWSDALSD